MFDAKKLRVIAGNARAELARKERETEEFERLEKERIALDEALKEQRRRDELRLKEEEDAARRRVARASNSLLQIVKRETVLSAAKGLTQVKINVESDIDKDWIKSELKERRFKISWNAIADTEEISKVVQLIDDYHRTQFIKNLPSGIPELDKVLDSTQIVFDFLLEEILHPDGAIFSKGLLYLAHIKWQKMTLPWREAFELASIYPIDAWATDAAENQSQNVKLLNILRIIYENINLMFDSGNESLTSLNVWWDYDWLDGDQSGKWDAYRLGWLSSYVGQHFINQLNEYLQERASRAESSASMLMEPLESNFERWGNNNVFRARVNSKPIGALIMSTDLTAFMLRSMNFKVEIEPKDGSQLLTISW